MLKGTSKEKKGNERERSRERKLVTRESALATNPFIKTGLVAFMGLLNPKTCSVMQSKLWHGSKGPPSTASKFTGTLGLFGSLGLVGLY